MEQPVKLFVSGIPTGCSTEKVKNCFLSLQVGHLEVFKGSKGQTFCVLHTDKDNALNLKKKEITIDSRILRLENYLTKRTCHKHVKNCNKRRVIFKKVSSSLSDENFKQIISFHFSIESFYRFETDFPHLRPKFDRIKPYNSYSVLMKSMHDAKRLVEKSHEMFQNTDLSGCIVEKFKHRSQTHVNKLSSKDLFDLQKPHRLQLPQPQLNHHPGNLKFRLFKPRNTPDVRQ
jgi:hypothetical protein